MIVPSQKGECSSRALRAFYSALVCRLEKLLHCDTEVAVSTVSAAMRMSLLNASVACGREAISGSNCTRPVDSLKKAVFLPVVLI
jgi:hypothetical protein